MLSILTLNRLYLDQTMELLWFGTSSQPWGHSDLLDIKTKSMMSKLRHKEMLLLLAPPMARLDFGTTQLKDIHKLSKHTQLLLDLSPSLLMDNSFFLDQMTNNSKSLKLPIVNSYSQFRLHILIGLDHANLVLTLD